MLPRSSAYSSFLALFSIFVVLAHSLFNHLVVNHYSFSLLLSIYGGHLQESQHGEAPQLIGQRSGNARKIGHVPDARTSTHTGAAQKKQRKRWVGAKRRKV